MKAKIFVGPRGSRKTTVARMIADHVGRDKTHFVDWMQVDSPFIFDGMTDKIELVIFDDYKFLKPRKRKDFIRREIFLQYSQSKGISFLLRANQRFARVEWYNVPSLIYIVEELDDTFRNDVYNKLLFDIIDFPLDKKQEQQ